MSVQVDFYLAPGGVQPLAREAFLDVAADLIRQKLVVPPYRLFEGGKGLATGLAAATRPAARKKRATRQSLDSPAQLADYAPGWDEDLPAGTKVLFEGDDGTALGSALGACDLQKNSVFVHFAGLSWNAERVKVNGRTMMAYPASVLLLSSPEALEFEGDREGLTTGTWTAARVRRQKVRFGQCLVLVGDRGPTVADVRGSVVEKFVRKHFGTPLQVVEVSG
jgi:hypothetical protein